MRVRCSAVGGRAGGTVRQSSRGVTCSLPLKRRAALQGTTAKDRKAMDGKASKVVKALVTSMTDEDEGIS